MWLGVEPLTAFQVWNGSGHGAILYAAMVLVGAIAGYFITVPRLPLEREVARSKVTVRVSVGDILEQEGNIVVGTNECFDTELTGGIISPNSLQGQLLERVYKNNVEDLDNDVDAFFAETGAVSEKAPEKTYGKKRRYEIGSTAVIARGKQRFFLLAYGRMPDSVPVKVMVDKGDFHKALVQLWTELGSWGQREPVHVPLLGGNFARFHGTQTQLLQMILLSFIATQAPDEVGTDFTVWVHPDQLQRIDLPALAVWLDSVCGR